MRKFIKKIFSLFKIILLRFKSKRIKINFSALIDRHSKFEGYNVIGKKTVFKGNMGRCSYIGENCKINADIGKYTCVASNVKILAATHPSSTFVSIHPAFYSTAKQCGISFVSQDKFYEYLYYDKKNKISCKIGNDVWIGENAVIIGGVEIGDGAIIAAGSVVNKNVEPYTIVGGVPTKHIKNRFTPEQTEMLLKIKFWDKDLDWIKIHADIFDNINNPEWSNIK